MSIRLLKHRMKEIDCAFALEVCWDFHKGWQWLFLAEQSHTIVSSDDVPIWCIPRGHRELLFSSFCDDASNLQPECFFYDIVKYVKVPFSRFRFCDVLPIWSPDENKLAFGELLTTGKGISAKILAVYDYHTRKHSRFEIGKLAYIQWWDESSLRILRQSNVHTTYLVSRVEISNEKEKVLQEIDVPLAPANISFSPNGEFISYHTIGDERDDMNFTVYVINLRDRAIAMRAEALSESIPIWSPTGKYLAFAGYGQQRKPSLIIVDVPSFEKRCECIINHERDWSISPTPIEPSWLSDDLIVIASLQTIYPKMLTKLMVFNASSGVDIPVSEVDGLVGSIVCPKLL